MNCNCLAQDRLRTMNSIKEFPATVKYSIENILKKEEYLSHKIHKQTISSNSGNYFGVICEIIITGETKEGDKETNLFVKVINTIEDRPWLSINTMYCKELFAYRKLFAIFSELQDEADVPHQERYNPIKSYEGSSTNAIILENMTKKGFKMHPRMNVVSFQYAVLCIKEIAKFHGLSFVLQKKRPGYINEEMQAMKFPFLGDEWQGFVKMMFNLLYKYVDNDYKDKFTSNYYKVTDKLIPYMTDEDLKVCFCHGDYKPTNIMMKVYNGEVTEVVPVDYQFLHYGCPVFDFLYFIFHSTSREFRKAHLSQLKDIYHDALKTFLQHFNIDVELVYPRKKFEEVYKAKLDYGLLSGYMFLPFMLASEGDAPDLTKQLTEIDFTVNDTYKDRLRGIIEDFIEWGYIV